MFNDTMANYDEFKQRKKTIEDNKQEQLDTIEMLNKEKEKELKKCWKKVNENFKKIFSTLLQGASARLVPVDEENISLGLSMRVSFSGGKEIDTLVQLSGGQRSLLALSLILALLKFQPAPLYILDEIDAALD